MASFSENSQMQENGGSNMPYYELFLLIAIASLSCAKAGEKPADDTPTQITTDLQLSENTGAISVSIDKNIGVEKVRGYILGSPIVHKLVTPNVSDLTFVFADVIEGKHDLIVSAVSSGFSRGIRINGINVSANQTSKVVIDRLPVKTTMSGRVTDISGIGLKAEVSIEGSDIKTQTNASGHYILEQVPHGKHDLKFISKGYVDGIITGLTVGKQADDQQKPMILSKIQEKSPAISVALPNASSSNLKVPFFVTAPNQANQMRLSDNDDFTDADWKPFASIAFYQFEQEGSKKIYAQFSKDGGNLSDIVSTEVSIQLP
jgi:hypothetical protein